MLVTLLVILLALALIGAASNVAYRGPGGLLAAALLVVLLVILLD